jgi:hypothetical protein
VFSSSANLSLVQDDGIIKLEVVEPLANRTGESIYTEVSRRERAARWYETLIVLRLSPIHPDKVCGQE